MGLKTPFEMQLRGNEKDGINIAMVTLMRNMLCEIYLGVICFKCF